MGYLGYPISSHGIKWDSHGIPLHNPIQVAGEKDNLGWGWSRILETVDPGREYKMLKIPPNYFPQVCNEILSGVPWKDNCNKYGDIDFDRVDVASLNKKHKLWMQLWRRFQGDQGEPINSCNRSRFECWMGEYDRIEAHWVWREKCLESKENAQLFVDWVRRSQILYID